MKRPRLAAITTGASLAHIANLLDYHFDIQLFDHCNSLAVPDQFLSSVDFERAPVGERSTRIFFYPDSVERFMCGCVGFSELGWRSMFVLRQNFIATTSSGAFRKLIFGNVPSNATAAANRLAFMNLRAKLFPSHYFQAYSAGHRISSSSLYTSGLIFRFLPDTHINVDGQTTAPVYLCENDWSELRDVEFPFILEQFVDAPYDLRLYVFGSRKIAVVWPRSSSQVMVDVRAVKSALGDERVDEPLPRGVTEVADFLKDHFGLAFFCVDFVTDMESLFFPVDLNVCPTWHWLSHSSTLGVSDALRLYTEEWLHDSSD